jgi:hypothetical protein
MDDRIKKPTLHLSVRKKEAPTFIPEELPPQELSDLNVERPTADEFMDVDEYSQDRKKTRDNKRTQRKDAIRRESRWQ